MAAAVAVGHFVLPFCLLLRPQLRRSRRGLGVVAGLLILSAVLHGWWLVVPASGRGLDLTDLLAMLGFGGIATGLALRAPLLPIMPEGVWHRG